jgi:hypothetical protein
MEYPGCELYFCKKSNCASKLLPHVAACHQPLQLPPDVSIPHRSNTRTVYSCRIPPFELGDRTIGQSQFVMCAPSEIFEDGIKQRLVNIWPRRYQTCASEIIRREVIGVAHNLNGNGIHEHGATFRADNSGAAPRFLGTLADTDAPLDGPVQLFRMYWAV